jgi:hypothetical protein
MDEQIVGDAALLIAAMRKDTIKRPLSVQVTYVTFLIESSEDDPRK